MRRRHARPLLVVSENYPQLKSNEGFLNLQARLKGPENRIADRAQAGSTTCRHVQHLVRSFPTVLYAGMIGISSPGPISRERRRRRRRLRFSLISISPPPPHLQSDQATDHRCHRPDARRLDRRAASRPFRPSRHITLTTMHNVVDRATTAAARPAARGLRQADEQSDPRGGLSQDAVGFLDRGLHRTGRAAMESGTKKPRQRRRLFVFVNDRKMFIQVGYGLEGTAGCGERSRSSSAKLEPHFRNNDFAGGLSGGHRDDQRNPGRVQSAFRRMRQRPASGKDMFSALFWIIVIIFIVITFVARGADRAVATGGGRYRRRGPGFIFFPPEVDGAAAEVGAEAVVAEAGAVGAAEDSAPAGILRRRRRGRILVSIETMEFFWRLDDERIVAAIQPRRADDLRRNPRLRLGI